MGLLSAQPRGTRVVLVYWTSEDEYHWQQFYRKWMTFLNDYKNAGGIVTTGSDSGFIYKLYGFDYIRELELLREAGFNPLEVIRAATYHGALQLHKPKGMEDDLQFGVLESGPPERRFDSIDRTGDSD